MTDKTEKKDTNTKTKDDEKVRLKDDDIEKVSGGQFHMPVVNVSVHCEVIYFTGICGNCNDNRII